MDGFLRPDTPLLCIYLCPLAVSGMVFSRLILSSAGCLHSPHSYSVSFATRLIRICNAVKTLHAIELNALRNRKYILLSLRVCNPQEIRNLQVAFENMPFFIQEYALLGARRACSQKQHITH